MSQAKTPPHSLEAERSVLGSLMLDNRSYDRVVSHVVAADFYVAAHQQIFQAIESLASRHQPYDVLTVADHLKLKQQLEGLGGEAFLYELVNQTPTAANAEAYAKIVNERSVLRQLITAGSGMVEQALSPDAHDVRELLDRVEQSVFKISQDRARGEGAQDIASLLAKATDRIDMLYHSEHDVTGLSTGFKDLDDMTSGLQEGSLVVVAGRPSMGKTAFSMNIAENVAMQTVHGEVKPVLIFSMEMPGESLAMRMMSSLGRIDQHKIRSGKLEDADWPRLTSAVSMLSEAKLFIDDTPALSPNEVRSRARRLAREYGGLSMIVIDYLQLMQVPSMKDNRVGEVSEISRNLKALAKELSIPVVALSQLNRGLEQRHDKRPVMSDLRESGAIEQDADLIAFIYRDEVYNEDSPDKGTAEIIIGKHRNGPIGKVRLTFLGRYTRFEDFAPTQVMADSPFGGD